MKASEQKQLCQSVEATISNDFHQWIVQKYTVSGEAAADYDVKPVSGSIEKVTEFR
jgi:hypothetical protein